MLNDVVPSDVVEAVFGYLKPNTQFSANIPAINTAFYVISKEGKYKDLFEGFLFDSARSYPYSEAIRDALDRLLKSELLTCLNPELEFFLITDDLAEEQGTFEEYFDPQEKEMLKEIADKFLILIKKE